MSWTPTVVHSRAEFEQLLLEHPMHLRATRPPRPLRVGHPKFVGPFEPSTLDREGTIRFDADGSAWMELPDDLRRAAWAKQRVARGGVR